ncbi:MAG TPA: HlyD family efflux transporter periplasmic adaptor subunit [Candidatus Paceibacterota bacterium]|nr:HlyD family efflux transporter periplasmic adaptor subunit [Candidatus Paceibacterota bacterium]
MKNMKRISFYISAIVILGAVLVSVWVYQKYFKKDNVGFLYFNVEKGDIQELVKARGEIVSEKNFDLSFPFSGKVSNIFVKEGQTISQNDSLIELETTDFRLELQKLQGQLKQAEAELLIKKAEAGNTENILNTVTQQQEALVTSAYSKLLSEGLEAEPEEENYEVTNPVITGNYKGIPGTYRFRVDKKYTSSTEIFLYVFGIEKIDPIEIKKTGPTALGTKGLYVSFSDDLESYVDKSWTVTIPNTESSVYSVNYNAYQQALAEKVRAIEEAKSNLANQTTGISIADAKILQAESEIRNYKSQIALIEEKIKKSTLYAPIDAKVTKIFLEKGEQATQDQIVIALGTSGFKIQTDISELEIVKIKETAGNSVIAKLDAFPDTEIKGKVFSIEPKEIIKEGDKYYRVNINIEPNSLEIRSGMSADLSIFVSAKQSVLKIPELAINKKEGKSFVNILEGKEQKEVEIKTGISDGEFIEVAEGLTEGQTVVVSAD